MSPIDWAAGPEPALVLLVALVLDGLLPDRFGPVPHPVRLIGAAVAWVDCRLNRARRSEAALIIRGALVVVALSALALAGGWALERVARDLPYGWVVELGLVAVFLAQRSLFDHVAAVARPLARRDLVAARASVAHVVGRDPDSLDAHGVARAVIESLAENFADAVVAPVFWYLLLGLPGLLLSKTVNTLDSMIGHRNPRYVSFGMTAARLDDALNYIPARLAGTILALAAIFVPTANPARAVRTMVRDAGKHGSLNAGWPEGATAGALGLAMAGPRRYGDRTVDDPWIGDGTARAEARDVRRALYLYAVACLLNGLLVGAFVLAGRLL
jgi:adenosylcobinamide-phosphate synthase